MSRNTVLWSQYFQGFIKSFIHLWRTTYPNLFNNRPIRLSLSLKLILCLMMPSNLFFNVFMRPSRLPYFLIILIQRTVTQPDIKFKIIKLELLADLSQTFAKFQPARLIFALERHIKDKFEGLRIKHSVFFTIQHF